MGARFSIPDVEQSAHGAKIADSLLRHPPKNSFEERTGSGISEFSFKERTGPKMSEFSFNERNKIGSAYETTAETPG